MCIPDAILAAKIREALELGDNISITTEDMLELRELDASNAGITDITGLEHATRLKKLWLGRNIIADLGPLSDLTSLTHFSLGRGGLSDLSALSGLTNLVRLYLARNDIVDVSPLAGLTSLGKLYLANNPITDTSPIYALVTDNDVDIDITVSEFPPGDVDVPDAILASAVRSKLNLGENTVITTRHMAMLVNLRSEWEGIRDLTGLEHATNLTELWLSYNSISDLSPLEGLTKLERLEIHHNNIVDVSPIAGLTNLTRLLIGGNDIETIAALSDLTRNLLYLVLGDNDIVDISVISGLTELRWLYLHENNISDVSPLASLRPKRTRLYVYLSGNPILDTSPLWYLLTENHARIDITVTEHPPWDVNEDGEVDATDSALVMAALGQSGDDIVNSRTDVNGNATVDVDDLTLVTDNLDAADAAPLNRGVFTLLDRTTLETLDPDTLVAQLAILRAKSDGSLKYQRAIALLESVLTAMRPEQTQLLANYPNPFNPETWLPYHLANPSDVVITIYDVRGRVVRRLALGHQREGYYVNRSRAGYWDGRNAVGEGVASGIYFYQFEADNNSLLRKMLILK